jgi:Polyketide cyclase / dehydrase and lipid transport
MSDPLPASPAPAIVLLLLVLASTLGAAAVPPKLPPPPTPEETKRLLAGEVLVGSRAVPGSSVHEQIGRGVVAVPPERVFRALTDWAHFSEFMPFVKKSDAAAQPDGSVIGFQSLQLPPPNRERHYRIRATARVFEGRDGRTWQTAWSYIPRSGNIVDHHGSWTLTAFGPGQTLATCILFTDPGGVPGWATNLGLAQTLPYIFSGLRQHVHRSRYDPPYGTM